MKAKRIGFNFGQKVDINIKIKKGQMVTQKIDDAAYAAIERLLIGRSRRGFSITSAETALKTGKVDYHNPVVSRSARFLGDVLLVSETPRSGYAITTTETAYRLA